MITLVAALAANGVIGAGGALPWHLPDDLRRFKALTMGKPMVMGRKTFDSIGRPLPGRRTIVVTRDPDWSFAGAETASSVDAALALAGSDGDVSIVGGGEIYRQTIGFADRLELTHVHRVVVGDTLFPPIDPATWSCVAVVDGDGVTFATYDRIATAVAPGQDLAQLLAGLDPELHDGEYVFCLADGSDRHVAVKPVAVVHEAEGKTLVFPVEAARAAGFEIGARFAWITLRVHSDLEAVGLTSAVSSALAIEGIACNMIAGYHHDHLFIPAARAADAVAVLHALSGR